MYSFSLLINSQNYLPLVKKILSKFVVISSYNNLMPGKIVSKNFPKNFEIFLYYAKI
jgi:hypothetical protein